MDMNEATDAVSSHAGPGDHTKAGVSKKGALKGPVFEYMQRLDAHLCTLASSYSPQARQYSPLLPVDKLDAADHFSSFPHQAMFAAAADPTQDNLKAFAAAPVDAAGHLNVPALDHVQCCLTPGACYPIYIDSEGSTLNTTEYITVRSTCFRQEEQQRLQPLTRQRSFSMREIVCIGAQEQVEEFLSTMQQRVENLFSMLGLPVTLIQATDPFFEPKRNKKFLMQKVAPLKLEMTYQDELAIGSINNHRDGFGRIFAITLGGEPVHSGCVAFGLERWVYCCINQFGDDPANWPELAAPGCE